MLVRITSKHTQLLGKVSTSIENIPFAKTRRSGFGGAPPLPPHYHRPHKSYVTLNEYKLRRIFFVYNSIVAKVLSRK